MIQDQVITDASVYTFGFGKNHDPDMLKAISDAANGMYYFIENEKQVSFSPFSIRRLDPIHYDDII